MRGWKLAGVGLTVGALVLTGCGGGDKATTASASSSSAPSTQAASTSTAKVSSQSFSSAVAIQSKLAANGVSCTTNSYSTPTAQSVNCNVDGDLGQPVLIYQNSSPTVFANRLRLATNMTIMTAGDAMYLVQGDDWFVSCTVLVQAKALSACTSIAKVVGGEARLVSSPAYVPK